MIKYINNKFIIYDNVSILTFCEHFNIPLIQII